MMNAGELREIISIEQFVNDGGYDENGFPVSGYVDYLTLRAKRKTVSTREYVSSADRATTEITVKFICRKRDIDNKMRLKHKEKLYNIKNVHEFEDKRFVEITAVEII